MISTMYTVSTLDVVYTDCLSGIEIYKSLVTISDLVYALLLLGWGIGASEGCDRSDCLYHSDSTDFYSGNASSNSASFTGYFNGPGVLVILSSYGMVGDLYKV